MILLQQMLVLFLLMIVGFICYKIHLINKEGNRVISSIVVNVANPALVLSSVINTDFPITAHELLLTFLIAFGMYFVLLLLAKLIPVLLKVDQTEAGIYKLMTVFSNIGFMGFPLLSAMYGPVAVLYASIFTIPYNILIYTYGISMIEADCKTSTGFASSKQVKKHFPVKKILNVGVMSCALALVIFFTKPQIPVFFDDTIDRLASLTAPLSMIVIGASMADMNIKAFIQDKKLLIFTLIKLIVIPILGMLLISCLGLSPLLTGVCLVMLATPVGSMTAMLSNQYDTSSDLASRGVALTTILSVLTMPLISMLFGI